MTEVKEFGFYRGYKCFLITLSNEKGFRAGFTNLGAAMQSLYVPDRNGNPEDVVLGYDTCDEYAEGCSCFGATVGRFANRIGGAKFTLNGTEYKLFANDRGNTLHGGRFCWNKRVWMLENVTDGKEPSVSFSYISPDGEENFPGTVDVRVTYTLLENGVEIKYNAVSDKDTVINLTNHSYFNLSGEGNGNIKNHQVTIFAEKYTPVDSLLIPTGKIAYVLDTPFDFRKPKKVCEEMDNGRLPDGFDHNFLLGENRKLRKAAEVYDEKSGRKMSVETDMPAMQFYIGIGLDNEKGKNGHSYEKYGGLCLETQFCPDSPNKPIFPDCVLKADTEFESVTRYTFD